MAKASTKTVAKTESKVGAKVKSKVKENRSVLVREEILVAKNNIEGGYVDLSRLLSEGYHKEYHLEWGFSTFEEYCKAELDVAYRKAMYLVEIWDKVKSLNIPKERISKLGWTKMKDLAAVITEENYKEWLAKADKMTTRELTDAVKVVRKGETGAERPATTTLKVVMSEAEASVVLEAIEESKKLCETESTSVALELICQDWMADKGALPQKTPLETMVAYVEKTYGVSLEVVPAKKKEVASGKKAAETEKLLDKADKKTKDRKKKGGGDLDELGDSGSKAPAGGTDINSLLGIKG